MKVGILGYATPLALEAAIEEKSAGTIDELWCFNPPSVQFVIAADAGYFDRWFDHHPVQASLDRMREWYVYWLAGVSYRKLCRVEVNGADDYAEAADRSPPPSDFHEFPVEVLRSPTPRTYHASSVDISVRYALHLGATEIVLFGHNGHYGSEPDSGRACLEYWCGYAEGRGTTIRLVDCWALLTNYEEGDEAGPWDPNPLYGYDRLARQSGTGKNRQWWEDLRYWREHGESRGAAAE